MIQQQQYQGDEPILMIHLPESEEIMSRKIDSVMIHRLIQICKSNDARFIPEVAVPLLNNSYSSEQFLKLIDSVQSP